MEGRRGSLSGPLFCGREVELELLESSIERLCGGCGGIVLIDGPPGIGKSRLIAEVVHIARGRGITAVCADCRDEPSPVALLRQIVGTTAQQSSSSVGLNFWSAARLVAQLEERVGSSGLIIAFDDLQW